MAHWKPGSATVFAKLSNSADHLNCSFPLLVLHALVKATVVGILPGVLLSTADFEAFLMMVFVSM